MEEKWNSVFNKQCLKLKLHAMKADHLITVFCESDRKNIFIILTDVFHSQTD